MQNTPTIPVLDQSGIDVADTAIRHLVHASRFPVERLLAIVRDVATSQALGPEAAWRVSGAVGETAHGLIESRSGAPFTSEELARRLGVTSETVRNLLKRQRLIAYPARTGKGSRFPKWQFRAAGTKLEIEPWVEPLLEAYGHNGWGLLDFLTVPRDASQGLSYLALLQQGRDGVDRVVAAARRSNPN
jgi:excisionase family DNA binding protein